MYITMHLRREKQKESASLQAQSKQISASQVPRNAIHPRDINVDVSAVQINANSLSSLGRV